MIVLLDMHYLLWAMAGDARMSSRVRSLMENTDQILLVSIVSLWEIAIKTSLGKLEVEGGIRTVIELLPQLNIEILQLRSEHLEQLANLPFIHRDPFDRTLIVQARTEGLHLLTVDPVFRSYDVDLVEL